MHSGNPRKCGMADDKSDVPLISAYDQGSVYEEPITNDLTYYPRLSREFNLNKKSKVPSEILCNPNLQKYLKRVEIGRNCTLHINFVRILF